MQPIAAGQHLRLHLDRQPEVRPLPAGFADKTRRCDTDDRQRRVAHSECLPEHVLTAAESALPVVVADDDGRFLAPIVGCRKDPADRRADAEHVKEPARHQPSVGLFPRATVDADTPAIEAALRCHHRRKTSGLIAQLFEFSVGEPRSSTVEHTCPTASLVRIREHDEAVGLLHAGKRSMQHAIPETEYRRVRANAERQRQDGDGGKAASGSHGAHRIAEVLPHIPEQVFRWNPRSHGCWEMRLPERRQVPGERVSVGEFGECQACGFIRQDAAGHQLAPAFIEMLRQFFDDFSLTRR